MSHADPILIAGCLQCIVATTFDDYRKHTEKDSALARRFTIVKVPEPTVGETVLMLQCLRSVMRSVKRLGTPTTLGSSCSAVSPLHKVLPSSVNKKCELHLSCS